MIHHGQFRSGTTHYLTMRNILPATLLLLSPLSAPGANLIIDDSPTSSMPMEASHLRTLDESEVVAFDVSMDIAPAASQPSGDNFQPRLEELSDEPVIVEEPLDVVVFDPPVLPVPAVPEPSVAYLIFTAMALFFRRNK